jgi:general secretion pathway protein A
MYKAFFGLSKSPFRLAPDPQFLFLTPAHREALSGLLCAIAGKAGLAVLSGDAGTGKTTLLRMLLESIPQSHVDFSYMLVPTVTPAEFLRMALMDFGITEIPTDKPGCIAKLQEFLISRRAEGRLAVLVVDEAHKLSLDVLEELRLLTNFEDCDGKLLQILLAGQNELDETLRRTELRQFKQRIAHRFSIVPLSIHEVGEYIQHRWGRAGATGAHPFTLEAVYQIALCSRGIPRVINTICDNALLVAFGAGTKRIEPRHVQEVVTDLDITLDARAPELRISGSRGIGAQESLSPDERRSPADDRSQTLHTTGMFQSQPRDGLSKALGSIFETIFTRRARTIELGLNRDEL